MSYQLIVPTIIETAVSGYVGAIERIYRDKLYRVEFWRHGTLCFKAGSDVVWEKLPHVIRKDAHAGFEQLIAGLNMAAEARGAA